ncbi:hypothetical protein B0H13DRAFT_2334065 [Mycena leptocephala]|nr:hypothetical protein B0H13DRAFT_2334065 [Mycena leptocephala]
MPRQRGRCRRDVRDWTAYEDTDPGREDVDHPDLDTHNERPRRGTRSHSWTSRGTRSESHREGFEVLDAPRRVIALDEDVFMNGPQSRFLDDDSDWEDIDRLLARAVPAGQEDALQAHRRGYLAPDAGHTQMFPRRRTVNDV